MKRIKYILVIGLLIAGITGCANKKEDKQMVESVVDFDEYIAPESEPIILREENTGNEETLTEIESESVSETVIEEIEPYVDRIAGDNVISYTIETAGLEDEIRNLKYPQLANMENTDLQSNINENIKSTILSEANEEGLVAYELDYEVASAGKGIVSFIFKGVKKSQNSAYPIKIVKTINIDINTGKNLRFKDFADMAAVVANLENSTNYEVISDSVDINGFSSFLNNGYITDYAMTLLDADIDFSNLEITTSIYSAIRDNHLVLFFEAEHMMGDYVEIVFSNEL